MTTEPRHGGGRVRFALAELSGSLGDLGTFLPIALALSLTGALDIGVVFVFAGLMNIATGLWFRQPIPVQPMKAIAAVAIADGLSSGAIAAAGLFVGAVVIALALVGAVDWVARIVPRPVVRGIQLGVGVKLAMTGAAWMWDLPAVGLDSWVVGVVAAVVLAVAAGRWAPALLVVFAAGLVVAALGGRAGAGGWAVAAPAWPVDLTSASDWRRGVVDVGIAQAALTLLNSVVAVCALSEDYFPGRGIPPRRMALSVGLMNLLCVPLGGMPMCHGSGGLAAQHRFGARTGWSVVMLGALKIAAGVALGGVLVTTLGAYPRSILAVMVVFAGVALAGAARDSIRCPAVVVALCTAGVMVAAGTLYGFLAGCAAAGALGAIRGSGWGPRGEAG
jgi:hypothetical protein